MALKSPEAVLRAALIANASVNSLVAGRIYPLRRVGTTAATFPLILWRRAGIIREQTLSGPMGVPRVRLELLSYAATYNEARDLADKCRAVLDGYGGTLDNVEVKQVALTDEFDDLVDIDGAETSLYLVQQTYEIWWQET